MAGIVPTNINAYYADLTVAKQEAAIAAQKVANLEDQIKGMDHPLPNEDGSLPEPQTEDTASSDDVSASETPEVKPLDKMNRSELEAAAKEAGIEAPEELDTKKDIVEAIQEAELEDQE